MSRLTFTLLAVVVTLAACDKKDGTPTAPSATPEATAVAKQAPGNPATMAAVQTAEDFEDEAEKSVTPDNLEAEVAKLEAELK